VGAVDDPRIRLHCRTTFRIYELATAPTLALRRRARRAGLKLHVSRRVRRVAKLEVADRQAWNFSWSDQDVAGVKGVRGGKPLGV